MEGDIVRIGLQNNIHKLHHLPEFVARLEKDSEASLDNMAIYPSRCWLLRAAFKGHATHLEDWQKIQITIGDERWDLPKPGIEITRDINSWNKMILGLQLPPLFSNLSQCLPGLREV